MLSVQQYYVWAVLSSLMIAMCSTRNVCKYVKLDMSELFTNSSGSLKVNFPWETFVRQ